MMMMRIDFGGVWVTKMNQDRITAIRASLGLTLEYMATRRTSLLFLETGLVGKTVCGMHRTAARV